MSPSDLAVIGVDVGRHGGLVVLLGRSCLLACPMPYREVDGVPCPDGAEIVRRVTRAIPDGMPTVAYLEHIFAERINGAIAMGRAQAVVLDRLSELCPVSLVRACDWQNAIKTHRKKREDRKAASIEHVRRHWPQINLMPGRHKTPHDGIADAACIAEYGQACEAGTVLALRKPAKPKTVKRKRRGA